MKNSTILLGILLLVLVGLAYLVLQKPGEQSVGSSAGRHLAEIDSAAVDRIEIRSQTGAVALEKRGAEWFVAQPLNYKADQLPVAQLLQQLKAAETKSVVSTKPEKHAMFQVDSAGTIVRVFERGSEKLSFILGKAGNAWTESYLRLSGSNDVVLAEGISGSTVAKPLRDWRDKNIVTIPREQIKEIRFQYGDTVLTVTRPDSVWKIGTELANDGQVQALLGPLSSVQADDFVDTTLSPAPKFSASIQYGSVQLQFSYNKSANKYYVLSSNSPQAFLMEPWRVNQLLKRKKELLNK